MKKRIIVEFRKDPNVEATLDAIAAGCRQLGHMVSRWRGPLSGRVPYPRRLRRCDLAILWNGTTRKYERALRKLQQMGAETILMELGWYPQVTTFQMDRQGINAAASWVTEELDCQARTPLPVRPQGDLLLILQHEADTQITCHSPWFGDMPEFLEHVCAHSVLPVRVRAHPRHPPADRVIETVERFGGQWDRSSSLLEAMSRCKAVACVNSSSAVEALAHQLPVLCFGEAIFRKPGVVYCLCDEPHATRRVTVELRENRCSLGVERMAAMLGRIRRNQWTLDQIPQRLPPLLEQIFGNADSPRADAGTPHKATPTGGGRLLRHAPRAFPLGP